MAEVTALIRNGKIKMELFVELGDAPPVSPIDGYRYSRKELTLMESVGVLGTRKTIATVVN